MVSDKGVSAETTKIAVMSSWPVPKTIKELRGFLGLTGYYRRFVRNYGKVAAPLNQLLKKDSFLWNEEATQAFYELRRAMTTLPVLALPDYTKLFVIESDASGKGLGAVLMQEGHPIAFWSKSLSHENQARSTYEKELMAVVLSVLKWRHYLLGHHFLIRIDHQSLKYLLEQRVATPFQQIWILKLIGYDYEIVYRSGKENKAADALSRRDDVFLEPATIHAISSVSADWPVLVQQSWTLDNHIQQLIADLSTDATSHAGYIWEHGKLTYKGCLVVGASVDLRKRIIEEYHNSTVGGHSGIDKTVRRIKRTFYWKGIHKDVYKYVSECDVCQRFKGENVHSPGLLQPLPIPERIWTNISMDFIEGLPKSQGQTTIYVVVDILTKYAHFMTLVHPYSAKDVAQLFMDNVFKLHGMPATIVSDRDAIFTSNLWQELFKLQGCQLHLSTTYHPQTDGQTEIVNKGLENYLKCMCGDCPKHWAKWLSLAEWWYNTSFHLLLKLHPIMLCMVKTLQIIIS